MAEYVTHEQAIEIAKKCRENMERLHGCDGHDFRRDEAGSDLYTCLRCGGWTSAESARWYATGHSHGYKEAMKGKRVTGKKGA